MIELYAGGDAKTVQGRPLDFTGRRCFSAAYGPYSPLTSELTPAVSGLLDSGAFSDSPQGRLTPKGALARQLAWEEKACAKWKSPGWRADLLVSYDLLIDEVWTGDRKQKRRWSVPEAELAVDVTVVAAGYLASQRERLAPRRLILACQGVDSVQYAECAERVLRFAIPGDVIGLGGWCILGWFRSWLPTFWATCRAVLPMIAAAGVKSVHVFGVMYQPALGGLLWLADRHGLAVSTDSSGPVLQTTWADQKKAGSLAPTWELNLVAWRERLASLRQSAFYREPPRRSIRQRDFWEELNP